VLDVFRLRAPNTKEVSVAREGAQGLWMQNDEQSVWSVTTARSRLPFRPRPA